MSDMRWKSDSCRVEKGAVELLHAPPWMVSFARELQSLCDCSRAVSAPLRFLGPTLLRLRKDYWRL